MVLLDALGLSALPHGSGSGWNGWNPFVGPEGYPPQVVPSNHPTLGPVATSHEVIFFFVAGAAVVILALPWAIKAAVRDRNWMPIIVIGSGLVCSLEEAMLDMLGHLHWAPNLLKVYTNFGVSVPLLIPLCYVAFLGLMSYFCYFVIRNGAHLRHYFMLLAMGGLADAVMETIGINLGVYKYYGFQPYTFLHFPYWWAFINSASFVAVGSILAYAVPRLKGSRKLILLLAAPYGMAGSYFTVGWVHFLAHNSNLPHWVRFAATTIMMVEACLYMVLLHHFLGVKKDKPALAWTLPRMLAYVALPGRDRLWAKMEAEGGLVVDREASVHELVGV